MLRILNANSSSIDALQASQREKDGFLEIGFIERMSTGVLIPLMTRCSPFQKRTLTTSRY